MREQILFVICGAAYHIIVITSSFLPTLSFLSVESSPYIHSLVTYRNQNAQAGA
jgi:hypothetical protein